MKVIVAGTLRIGPDKIQRLRPHMLQMLTASRAEDGCFTYSYAEDAGEPGLIRIFEVWRDEAALQASRPITSLAGEPRSPSLGRSTGA